MKNTAIYIRVSTEKQVQEGDSIPAQRDALRKYINDRQDLAFAGEYVDDGVSGTKFTERDELQRMLSDVQKGKIDLIIFTKLDRFYRSIRHYTATQEILDQCGVGWIAIWEPIYDTTSPQGRLIVNQMMSIAQFEAEHSGLRVKQIFRYKIENNEVVSGSVPAGYKIVDKHLVPGETAPYIRECFEDYSRCGCLFTVLEKWGGVHGIPRSRSALRRLLSNSLYVGEHKSGKKDYCPPIVSRDLFDDVQRKLSINIKVSQKRIYLFSGLLRCSECGKAMNGYQKKEPNGTYSNAYRCTHHYNFKPRLCTNGKTVREKQLEKYLLGSIKEITNSCIIECEKELKPREDRAALIAKARGRLDRLKDLYLNELITLEEYREDRAGLLARLEDLEQEPDAESAQERLRALYALQGADVAGIYAELTQSERRRFWRGIIACIHFSQDRRYRVDLVY